jgi:hypothetical protein
MKQYRITSEHFVPQGETGETDAVMDAHDLRELKRLSGLPFDLNEDNGAGLVGGNIDNVPQAQETGTTSPVGSNISWTAAERNMLVKTCRLEWRCNPGDTLWMLIMFEKPGLKHRSLQDAVAEFQNKNPKERSPTRRLPGD